MGYSVVIENAETDEIVKVIADPFVVGEAVLAGIWREFNGQYYQCIQSHTTQADWTPDTSPALWLLRFAPGVIPDWVQPAGAHDAYNIGDQVRFEGRIYESLVNDNVWSPTAYPAGWMEVV